MDDNNIKTDIYNIVKELKLITANSVDFVIKSQK